MNDAIMNMQLVIVIGTAIAALGGAVSFPRQSSRQVWIPPAFFAFFVPLLLNIPLSPLRGRDASHAIQTVAPPKRSARFISNYNQL